MDSTGEPQLLLIPPTPDDHYTQAEWSPDGTFIYYVHYNSKIRHAGQLDPVYNLFRMRFPDGQPEKLKDSAFWSRPSSDSSMLVYIFVDPETARNELFVANADGSDAWRVTLSGPQIPEIIDAPIFLPDGQSILFSAPEPTQSYQPNFFERLIGIQVVKAHAIPSDWWSVPVTGGVPTQLTHLQTINLFASISPDQQHLASVSGEGIFVMDLDGSNLTQLVADSGVHGTVSWIP
jgi:Tol biopolymer transport system component